MEVEDIKIYEVFHLHLNNYAGQMVTRVPVSYTINLKIDRINTHLLSNTTTIPFSATDGMVENI